MDTAAVLALLQDVADQVITPRFRDLTAGQVAEKNPGDLVTVADHEAEVLITQALRAAYPDALMLGEEAHAADKSLLRPSARPPTPSRSTPSTAPRTSCTAPPTTR